MGKYLKEGRAFRAFMHNMKLFPRNVDVYFVKGKSGDVLGTIDLKFDIIYVDGAHTYAGVADDLRACSTLLAEDGIICGDDLEVQLHEADASEVRSHSHLAWFRPSATDQPYHPGVTLAVAEHFGPVSNFHGFWAMQRNNGGFHPVSLAGAMGAMPRHWPARDQERVAAIIRADGVLAGLV
jgi:hypothetical protein